MKTKFGYCNIPLIPVRREASHKSEMISQILFGEVYSVLQQTDNWYFIKCACDAYEGYISSNQYFCISEKKYEKILHSEKICKNYTLIHDLKHNYDFWIAPSSSLPCDNELFEVKSFQNEISPKEILEIYMGSPYLWGGRTPWGLDCSGFVQAFYKTQGIYLPRDTSQQFFYGEEVGLDEAKFGDLAFFHNDSDKITHVGIILQKGKIIHCSGRVRIDSIDIHGIRREDNNYSHRLNAIKKIKI